MRPPTLVLAMLVLVAAAAPAQQDAPPTRPPTTSQASTQPASQPTTTQAVQEQKREAEIKQELAKETAREAESKLHEIHAEQRQAQREVRRTQSPQQAQARLAQLEFEETFQRRQTELAALRTHYADQRRRAAERKEVLAARRDEAAATLATLDELTPEQRRQRVAELDSQAAAHQAQTEELRSSADTEQANVSTYQQLLSTLAEERAAVDAEPASPQRDEQLTQVRRALAQAEDLVDQQQGAAYAISEQAWIELALADECRREAEALRAANRRFWVQHAYIQNIAVILAVTIGVTITINLLAWLIAGACAAFGRRLQAGTTVAPGVKRVRTLVYFARSIAKLLVWVFAIVTILAEFGISPGHSAGALGVIGLVLAGMFQQVVVDFVKGIDIAAGGHYFIGDFLQVDDKAGHVLNITVKYTVLRTPSGQILNIPNSHCIPSRRYPAGYVDNYVDIPIAEDVDVARVQRMLAEVGRDLNQRVEAVKSEPEFIATYQEGPLTVVRTRVRVLPTCDWVVKEHYIPMIKRRCEAEQLALAGEPTFFFINNVETFRQLFSRQLSESQIALVARDEAQPTRTLPDLPDPNAPTAPDTEAPPRGPIDPPTGDATTK
ncbi:MAG: mechanosensitive ion channel [Planctomycetes bacterium]|nr:mechanosensitive ion channel [Planctomycetota bacterium]